ncbi:MAG: hypothetical protein ABJF88_15605 [Rhodothermales bacterium]
MVDPYASDPIDFLRPRDAGDVLSDSLTFIRDHFVEIGRSLLYIAGPPFLLSLLVSFFYQDEAVAMNPLLNPGSIFDPEAADVSLGFTYLLLGLLSTVTALLATGVGFAYTRLYVEGDGTQPIEVAEVWQKTKGMLAPLFLYPIGLYLLLVVSMVILLVPIAGWIAWPIGFVYVLPIMWMAIPTRLAGERGLFASLRRARHLLDGYWWQTLWLIILVVVLCVVITVALSIPSIALGAALGALGGGEVDLLSRVVLTLSGLVGSLVYVLYVFYGVSAMMHYYNLVTKQEGAPVPDLEGRIDAIGRDDDAGWDDAGWDEGRDADRLR